MAHAPAGPFSAAANAVETRLGAVETRLVSIEARLGAVEARLGAIESGMAEIKHSLAAILLALGLPGAGAAAVDQARAAARRANAVSSDEPFVLVTLHDGSAPTSWPPGFCRAALRTLSSAAANALFGEYAIAPAGGSLDERRKRVAAHIGAVF
jgi:hypothetical protein